MEALIVVIASIIGTIFNFLLLVDAVRTRWLVVHSDPPRPELEPVAEKQVYEWAAWLSVQLAFLVIGTITIVSESITLRSVAFFMLIAIPIGIAIRSFVVWVARATDLRQAARKLAGENGEIDPELGKEVPHDI